MIKRKQYSEEFKRRLRLELSAGIITAAGMSKREGISSTRLCKRRDMVQGITIDPDEKEVLGIRRRIKDLEETVSELGEDSFSSFGKSKSAGISFCTANYNLEVTNRY